MKWSQRKTRFRVLIVMEVIVIALMMVLVYGTNPATTSEAQTEPISNVWMVLLLFLLGIMGLLFQSIGLIGLFVEKMWAKHFFSIGVCASAITSISGKVGMAENWFLALLALFYWVVAGAIIALSYEKQNSDTAENI